MSNGKDQQLGVAGGSGVQAVSAPAQFTTLEQLLNHMRANNELLGGCLADVRAFLSRAVGEGMGNALQPTEVVTSQTGLVGSIDDALNEQTCLLSDMRESLLVIEKLA